MTYEWERKLKPYVEQDLIDALAAEVTWKAKLGIIIKWSLIIVNALLITSLVVLVTVLATSFKLESRIAVIAAIISFELGIVALFSPLHTAKISSGQVDSIVKTHVSDDIMAEIRSSVEDGTSGIEKWFGGVGLCASLALALVLFLG